MNRITAKFTVFELVIIALTASLGVAVKPVASSLAKIITGPLAIPGGVLAGGIYMFFLVLAYGLTQRRLSATLTALVQAILVIITGIGSQGVMSLVTYIVPGIAVDLVMFLFGLGGRRRAGISACFFSCMAANLSGSFLVGITLFDIPTVPLLLSLCVAALSGGLGGLLAYAVISRVKKLELLQLD